MFFQILENSTLPFKLVDQEKEMLLVDPGQSFGIWWTKLKLGEMFPKNNGETVNNLLNFKGFSESQWPNLRWFNKY